MQQYATANHPLHKRQEAIWLLIALLTPLFVNFWVEQQFEASKIWLLRTLVWVLALLWLADWLVRPRPKVPSVAIRIGTLLLLLVITLSTILSTNPTIALFGTLDRANGFLTQASYLLLFWCVATQIDTEGSSQLLHVILATALPICLLGVAQAAGWQPLPVHTDARSLITTTLGRANFTGAYLALLLPLTLTAAQATKAAWRRIGYAALLGLEIIVIALTWARAAWIASIVGISVLLWLQHAPGWKRPIRWGSALGGFVALAGALLLLLQRGMVNGDSIAARWTIWQASMRLLWPRLWLGYGADTLELHFPSVFPPQLVYYQGRGVVVDRAHNWLLDWSLNYGIVATVIFCTLVLLIFQAGWQRLGRPRHMFAPQAGDRLLAERWIAACIASISAQLVGNLFLFEVAATAVLFWLLLAIITAGTAKDSAPRTRVLRPLWIQRIVIAASVIVVGGAVWASNVAPLLADLHSWRATQALARGNPAAALAEYATAVRKQPKRAAYHVAVALTAAQTGNFEMAERAMDEAIVLRPTDPILYIQLAAIYARETVSTPEKVESAYWAYEQAIVRSPTTALIYQQYADLALRSGDGELARVQAERAVDLDATDGFSFGILGWSHLQADNLAAAQIAFEQAVKWQPDSADFYLGLATVYFRQQRFDLALQAVEQSLLLDPTYAPARTLRVQLQER